MGLFINQQNTRTKLQERIAADLADKAKNKAKEDSANRPGGIDDSAYLENTKPTTNLAWVWVLIATLTIGIIAYFLSR